MAKNGLPSSAELSARLREVTNKGLAHVSKIGTIKMNLQSFSIRGPQQREEEVEQEKALLKQHTLGLELQQDPVQQLQRGPLISRQTW